MDTPITISDKPARQTKDLTIGCLIFPRLDQIDRPTRQESTRCDVEFSETELARMNVRPSHQSEGRISSMQPVAYFS
jgi:hypothetical protein